jgi:DNA-binding response OmpR family regulator
MYLTHGSSVPNLFQHVHFRMSKQAASEDKKTILIVEDSLDFSNLLKFIVEDEGFEGVQFPLDNADIVHWATEYNPVTILMDLALRRKSGMDYIEDLKANPETKSIPIVVITGRELPSKDVLALEYRGIKYVRKGRVEMDEIKNVILESARAYKPS